MEKYCGFFIVLCISMMAMSCRKDFCREKKQMVTSERIVHEFEKIVINTNCDVHFTQGDQIGVKIVGPENAVKTLVSECKGMTLTLYHTAKYELFDLGCSPEVDVYITAPDLIGVTLKGSGDFVVEGHLDTDTLAVELNGTGDMKIKSLICDEVNASVRGAYDLNIGSLQCSTSNFKLYGVGDINIAETKVNKTFIQLKGVGDVNVDFNQCGTATCLLYGVGDIKLKGSLRSLDKTVRGTGNIDTEHLRITR